MVSTSAGEQPVLAGTIVLVVSKVPENQNEYNSLIGFKNKKFKLCQIPSYKKLYR
jgi:hypothetical protein